MDKKRALAIADFTAASGVFIRRGTYVWLMETLPDGKSQVEYKGRLHVIPEDHLQPSGAASPSREKLMKNDPCFGAGLEAFELIHKDDEFLFSIYQCKEHGAWFLEDVRTGIGWYTRFIFLAEPPGATLEEFRKTWRRYSRLGDDELRLAGIMAPFPPGPEEPDGKG